MEFFIGISTEIGSCWEYWMSWSQCFSLKMLQILDELVTVFFYENVTNKL